MSFFSKAWDSACGLVHGAGHYAARVATAGVVITGKTVKYACKGVSSALESVGADRLANTIDNAGEAVDNGAQTASDVVTAATDIATGTILATGSFIVGEDATADKLGDNIRETLNSLDDNAEAAVAHVTIAKDNFVGKAQFDEAHREYTELVGENAANVAEIAKERKELNDKINEQLKSINERKNASKGLFDRFVSASCKIAEWRVARYETSDVFIAEPVMETPLKSVAEIFADVDFCNDPIWNHIKGVFTAGLLTVSQVEDANVKIEGYKRAARSSWDQDREINSKYRKLLESLEFVGSAFDVFVPLYSKLQDELEYALSSISQIMAHRDIYYFADANVKVNPYFLPKHHLNILMACDKLTRILCEMNKRHYIQMAEGVPVTIEEDREKVASLKLHEYREVEMLLAS